MAIEIIVSGDGSHTLFVPELNETYHSHHGALQESLYVFINKGLEEISNHNDEVTILEVGFGTGLNAVLTLIWANDHKIKINYITLEPFPLDMEIYEKLNYLELLNRKDLNEAFLMMHSVGEEELVIGDYFRFQKFRRKLEEFESATKTDLIYFDAFAPNKQPEVWTLENMQRCKDFLKQNGMLVSYCASGQFKRNLKAAGFEIETLQGPPGKKEMTRGMKI